ncbi:MAG: LysM peptidoglycan-binding domain-containing protein [Pseudohongiellaceae bacterium]|nr:LysM peptidoglycan-binding domain-containing protein [Pseudohongiellaceae bacterium]
MFPLLPRTPAQSSAQTLMMTEGLKTPRLFSSLSLILLLSACSTLEQGANEQLADIGEQAGHSTVQGSGESAAQARKTTVKQEQTPIVHQDIWSRMVAGFQFNPLVSNDRINREIAKYLESPEYFRIVSERASPFLYEIVRLLEEREMPTELALLPFIESAYNPNAAAPPDTVGLWQIMGSTGRSLGLQQDWWYDGRRDPIASTEIALDYLAELYQRFDEDWSLALAAYNTGPGNLQRAIRRAQREGKSTDYWSLSLPRITREYVPKLIALSRIIAQRDAYEIALTDIGNHPVISRVEVGSQIDLALAAELADVDSETLYQLNSAYRQWATHPDHPQYLLLPLEHADSFTLALSELDESQRVTWDRYLVRSGDTLSAIASRYNTTVSALRRANSIRGSRIIAGESLLIPRSYRSDAPISAPKPTIYSASSTAQERPTRYTVRSGDSLWTISRRFDISTSDLASWNNIAQDSILRPGQELHLLADPSLASVAEEVAKVYEVRAGDTLGRIARELGVALEDLLRWNNINSSQVIHPGQQLIVIPNVN